jgi:hypothetical protein
MATPRLSPSSTINVTPPIQFIHFLSEGDVKERLHSIPGGLLYADLRGKFLPYESSMPWNIKAKLVWALLQEAHDWFSVQKIPQTLMYVRLENSVSDENVRVSAILCNHSGGGCDCS